MANIDVPLRMNMTPTDLDYRRIIRAMYGQYNIRGGYFYGSSPRGTIQGPVHVPSLGGFGDLGEFGELGDMATFNAYYGLQNCGAATTVGDQYACSQANQAVIDTGSYLTDPCSPHNVDYSDPSSIPPQCGGSHGQQVAVQTGIAPPPQVPTTYAPPPPPAPPPITQQQASQQTGKPNQSVPPQSPLTPGSTGFTSTAQTLANQAAGGGGDLQPPAPPSTNTMLYIGAALAALILFTRGGR